MKKTKMGIFAALALSVVIPSSANDDSIVTAKSSYKGNTGNFCIRPTEGICQKGIKGTQGYNDLLPPVLLNSSLDARLDNYISQMTLREKVAQMIIVISYGDHCNPDIGQYDLGGVFFIGKRTANELENIVEECNTGTKIPVFSFSDEESAVITRIKGSNYPYTPEQIRKGRNPEAMAYTLADAIGKKMNEVGLNGDFAPILDVYSPKSAIGFRNFHDNKYNLVSIGRSYIEALHLHGIIATGKHFPGYGDTQQHSDEAPALNDISEEELIQGHRYVFDQLKSDLDAIMISNVIYTKVDNRPALFSEKIVGWAREGFDGVIMSDDLLAKSLTSYLGGDIDHRQRAVLAVKAGLDIIIDRHSAYPLVDSIAEAVQKGEIPEEQIDDSVRRILKLKMQYANFELPNQ